MCILTREAEVVTLKKEVRERLQQQINELKKRMQYDANDLDYETHLHRVRELQKILDKAGEEE